MRNDRSKSSVIFRKKLWLQISNSISLPLFLLLCLWSRLSVPTIVEAKSEDVFCPTVYEPLICGPDNKFYSNWCWASVAGFDPDEHCTAVNDDDDYSFGDDDDDYDDDNPIMCIMIHDPVICYPKGEIFSNKCVAEHEGGYNPADDCKPYDEADACTEEYDPVICGNFGDIFDNDCFAKLEGEYNPEIDCKPYLEYDDEDVAKNSDADDGSYPDSACTREYKPTSCGYGDEKKIFVNECYARKAGYDTDDSSICAFFMDDKITANENLDCMIEGGEPVYCQGVYFINECYASNSGYDVAQDCSVGGIPKTFDDDGYYIACPDIWEPLNCEGTIYSNSCYAELEGYTPLIDCFSVSDGDDDPDFCTDDSSFRFNLTATKTRSCKWLAGKSISRKRNVCQDVAGVNIHCQHTCGSCNKSCSDNEIFLFTLKPGKVRSCKWLSTKDDERIRNVCTYIDGVIDECKETCGKC